MSTTVDTTAELVAAAKADAALFVAEFPGESLEGSDWDAEAFAQVESAIKDSIESALGEDSAWPIYSEALRAEVARLSCA